MIFQRNPDISAIQDFYIKTEGQDKTIAYGPGSIINGSVVLTLEKPIAAYSIRVIFKCEEFDQNKKDNSTIFSVDSIIWGGQGSMDDQVANINNSNDHIISLKPQNLTNGCHMYLFAIKLPLVNYPPSMHNNAFGHRIQYTLQGVIDLVSVPHLTSILPVLYLPLVTGNQNPISKKLELFQKEDKTIEISAELIKPFYCPGDTCTIKVITNNNSEKINQVQIALNAIISTQENEYVHKEYTLFTETFFVAIPKQSKDHTDIFKLELPSGMVPTFTNTLGKYIDIRYQINITIQSQPTGITLFPPSQLLDQYLLSLPILITVPHDGLNVVINNTHELPLFVPNIDSPLPSPSNSTKAYSVTPSDSIYLKEDDDFPLNQDSSGYLIVPERA